MEVSIQLHGSHEFVRLSAAQIFRLPRLVYNHVGVVHVKVHIVHVAQVRAGEVEDELIKRRAIGIGVGKTNAVRPRRFP